MARTLFGGSSDDYAVDTNGRPLPNRRIRFYTSAAMTTEITDIASDLAGTGTPLAVSTNGYGFWGPVYLPDGTDGSDAHPVYAGAADGAGNPPKLVVRIYSHTAVTGGVSTFMTRTGDITLLKADVTSTGLAAADVGADATGAAATVQTNLTAEVTRAQAAEAALGGGMQFRTAVVVATANQASLAGLPTVDGVTLTAGQVILLTAQSTGSQNGLWAVAVGAWARPSNFAVGFNATATSVLVESGTAGAGTTYAVTGTTNNVVGTNVLTFVKTSGSAASGAGLPTTFVSKTTTYTATVGDYVLADATSAGFTITLPTSPAAGALVAVEKSDAGANVVTVAPAGGGTVNGDANATIVSKSAWVFEHVGSNAWRVAAGTGGAGTSGTAGVTSFNTRTGTVTLVKTDVTGTGLAGTDLSATGTPSSTTFLRGDNTWATPAGGGGSAPLDYPATFMNPGSYGPSNVVVANAVWYHRVYGAGSISNVRLRVSSSSGNIAVAAYQASGTGVSRVPGTMLASSGSVACPAAGDATVALGSTVSVAAGDFLAVGADNGTAQFVGATGSNLASNLAAGQAFVSLSYPPANPATSPGAQIGRTFFLVGV